MAFCSNCGSRLDEGVKFCPNCGEKVERIAEGTAAQENPAQPANPYAPPQAEPAPQYAYTGAPPRAQERNPWQYYCDVWKKYAVFQGRARRAEYWWFTLFNCIIYLVLGFIDGILDFYITDDIGLLSLIYELAVFLPSWSVMVRRFHDVDKRAWFCLVPVYGWIVLPCTAGTIGPNRFGPDPKQVN